MTLRFLLDTDIVSAPVAKQPNREVVLRLERQGHECAICAPVWHKLNFGVRRLPSGKRRITLTAYLEDVVGATFPILPYEETAAAWHARERARLEKQGTPAPYVDGQIASIAQTNGLVLVTANPRHFANYEELELENWTKQGRRA
ncbi:MAG: type II toxin-antitoxin system VapC family toxin [Vitreimonas sp.]